MAFFSWPSRAETDEYLTDGETIEGRAEAIADFSAASRPRAAPIGHVIAHRGPSRLLRAFDRIARDASRQRGAPFGQTSAGAGTSTRACSPAAALSWPWARRSTSRQGQGAQPSSWLQGHDRVGFEPPVAIFPKIETISVTQLDLDLLGHGYIAEARPVLEDMGELLDYGTGAAGRKRRLEPRQDKGRGYWAVKN